MHPIIKARFEQFSDGVFAIAITLLALELHIPTLSAPTIRGALWEIVPLIPSIATFVLSFMTIAIFWVNHNQLSQMFERIAHRRILWANIVFLLFVTLIPFATQATTANVLHPLSLLGYSLVFFGASISFTMLRFFVHREVGENRIAMGRSFVGPLCYLLAAASTVVLPQIFFICIAIPALFYFLPKDHQKD